VIKSRAGEKQEIKEKNFVEIMKNIIHKILAVENTAILFSFIKFIHKTLTFSPVQIMNKN
jgi:hypothetical protein